MNKKRLLRTQILLQAKQFQQGLDPNSYHSPVSLCVVLEHDGRANPDMHVDFSFVHQME